jgi:hypothetical protein
MEICVPIVAGLVIGLVISWKWPALGWLAAVVVAPLLVAFIIFSALVFDDWIHGWGAPVWFAGLAYAGLLVIAGFAGRRYRRARKAAGAHDQLASARLVSR